MLKPMTNQCHGPKNSFSVQLKFEASEESRIVHESLYKDVKNKQSQVFFSAKAVWNDNEYWGFIYFVK